MSMSILYRYRHPNLLTLMGFCACLDNFCLIYEFMSYGTLEDALASSVKAGEYKHQSQECEAHDELVSVIVTIVQCVNNVVIFPRLIKRLS